MFRGARCAYRGWERVGWRDVERWDEGGASGVPLLVEYA